MKIKKYITFLMTILLLLKFSQLPAQKIRNANKVIVGVLGNCGTCKKIIEKAAFKKRTSMAVWDMNKKVAILTFDSTKINQDEILKNIALAGYDNEHYIAPDNSYNDLDGCCRYRKIISSQSPTLKVERYDTQHDSLVENSQSTNLNKLELVPTQNPLNEVYALYFNIKDGLVMDDVNDVANAAKKLSVVVSHVDIEKLAGELRITWLEISSKINSEATEIGTCVSLDKQRLIFTSLTKNLHDILDKVKPNYEVYYDYCPMKEAYWLSKEIEIKNPYYGKTMLTCGSNIKIIK
jgi:hypothetical protein